LGKAHGKQKGREDELNRERRLEGSSVVTGDKNDFGQKNGGRTKCKWDKNRECDDWFEIIRKAHRSLTNGVAWKKRDPLLGRTSIVRR